MAHSSFDAFADALKFLIVGMSDAMLWLPALVLIALFALGAWFIHRSWKLCAMIVLSLLLVINLGYWEETVRTFALILFATGTCVIIGVPLGHCGCPSSVAQQRIAARCWI